MCTWGWIQGSPVQSGSYRTKGRENTTLSEGQDEDKGEIIPLLRENKPKSNRGLGSMEWSEQNSLSTGHFSTDC